ncbi:hypothetical protein [Phyllobacterium brassicacearum]|uniref:hypothetical protein n=1 Tax=Phyllobacterium brassicacearum TaxID=314235 RepID=UPI00105D5DD2|nr:hypothetical protein [Phyllobacterium brassicacearum]TDQ35111.1 hypothetical protein DEV91_102313 [Phyllobacterium brassicacearum]
MAFFPTVWAFPSGPKNFALAFGCQSYVLRRQRVFPYCRAPSAVRTAAALRDGWIKLNLLPAPVLSFLPLGPEENLGIRAAEHCSKFPVLDQRSSAYDRLIWIVIARAGACYVKRPLPDLNRFSTAPRYNVSVPSGGALAGHEIVVARSSRIWCNGWLCLWGRSIWQEFYLALNLGSGEPTYLARFGEHHGTDNICWRTKICHLTSHVDRCVAILVTGGFARLS